MLFRQAVRQHRSNVHRLSTAAGPSIWDQAQEAIGGNLHVQIHGNTGQFRNALSSEVFFFMFFDKLAPLLLLLVHQRTWFKSPSLPVNKSSLVTDSTRSFNYSNLSDLKCSLQGHKYNFGIWPASYIWNNLQYVSSARSVFHMMHLQCKLSVCLALPNFRSIWNVPMFGHVRTIFIHFPHEQDFALQKQWLGFWISDTTSLFQLAPVTAGPRSAFASAFAFSLLLCKRNGWTTDLWDTKHAPHLEFC